MGSPFLADSQGHLKRSEGPRKPRVGNSDDITCGKNFSISVEGTFPFISSGYTSQGSYPPNLNCRIDFTFASDFLVLVRFVDFQLEYDASCNKDYLEFISGGVIDGRFCGTSAPGGGQEVLLTQSSQSQASLIFTTDSQNQFRGFRGYIRVERQGTSGGQSGGDSESLFMCSNGRVVSISNLCNSVNDCGDNSDESQAKAGCEGQFTCQDGSLIGNSLVCNGYRDCTGGEDEKVNGCDSFFYCSDGKRILKSQTCNGINDCKDKADETFDGAGCQVDHCRSNPCRNGGSCQNSTDHSTFKCICTSGWQGPFCDTDAFDECSSNPCLNGGTCFNGRQQYLCACVIGFAGQNCQNAVGSLVTYRAFVSTSVGTDDSQCGASQNTPCRTVMHTLSRSPDGTVIILDTSTVNSTMNGWLTRGFVINGIGTSQSILFQDLVLSGTINKTSSFIFNKLSLTGKMFIENARLVITRAQVSDGQILILNNAPNSTLQLSVVSSTINRTSVISLGQSATLKEFSITLVNSTFIDSTFNVSCQQVLGRIEDTVVKQENQTLNNDFGMFFYVIAGPSSDEPASATSSRSRSRRSLRNSKQDSLLHTPSEASDLVDRISGLGSALASAVRQKRQVVNKLSGRLTVRRSKFLHINQSDVIGRAALRLFSASAIVFRMEECQFQDNERALELVLDTNSSSNVIIQNSNFTNNRANGPGGAIHVVQAQSQLSVRIENCRFENNYAIALTQQDRDNAKAKFNEDVSMSLITGSGGAIGINLMKSDAVAECTAFIKNCHFNNNSAENYGGSVYFTARVVAELENNTFYTVDTEGAERAKLGDILESRGDLSLSNNTFIAVTAVGEYPILSYRAEKDGSFLQLNDLNVICPRGFLVATVYEGVDTNTGRTLIETLMVYCRPCARGTYSLDISHVLFDQNPTLQITNVTAPMCNTCPYGATCNIDVQAKANFWGERINSTINMYICPEEYCCPYEVCDAFDRCAENRVGEMCGRCADGYSESLFSSTCIPDQNCSYITWFWAVIVLYGVAYVLFFVFQEECDRFVKVFTCWFMVQLNKCKYRGKSGNNKATKEEKEAAYLQIFMYFIQTPSLLRLEILYKNDSGLPLDNYVETIKSVFYFNIFGSQWNTCLFKGVTAVFKTAVQSAYVLYFFVLWIIFYLIAAPVNLVAKDCTKNSRLLVNLPLNARFLGAFVNLLLYTYQYFAENAFTLLKCVRLSSTGENVLFIDGSTKCYTVWQMAIIAVSCIYIFPFFIVLLFAPSLLKWRVISVRTFLLSLIFPIIGSPFLIVLFIKESKANRSQYGVVQDQRQTKHKEGAVSTIVSLISEPYRQDWVGGLCWEGVIALRRLCLVLTSTLIGSVIFRHMALVGICFISLLTHIRTKPFVFWLCNSLETLSLAALLFMSIINLLKASYFDSGEVPDGAADTALRLYDWFEVIMIGFIPTAIVAFAALCVLIRLAAFMCSPCLKEENVVIESADSISTHTESTHTDSTAVRTIPRPRLYLAESQYISNTGSWHSMESFQHNSLDSRLRYHQPT